jgi:hypothetical protein
MILHIAPDGNFIDSAIKSFEEADSKNNKFIIVTNKKKLYNVKSENVKKATIKYLLSKEFISKLSNYEFVVIHVLTDFSKKLILESNENIKFLWIGWGFDYYKYIKKDLFLPKTLKYINKNKSFFSKDTLRVIRDYFNKVTKYSGIDRVEIIFNKINYFSPVIYEDYILLKNDNPYMKMQYIDWNYGNLEDLVVSKDYIIGNNILLGNSATPENNHLEILDTLKNLNLENNKIIVPLSYGDKKYGNLVGEYRKISVGKQFFPLTEFMPLEEYNKILNSCSVVIMNHLRQQGMGNIVTMLYYGAKVFLNKENPIYNFLLRNKVIVFSIDELNEKSINLKLDKVDIARNRIILEDIWSSGMMLKKTKNLINKVKNGHD